MGLLLSRERGRVNDQHGAMIFQLQLVDGATDNNGVDDLDLHANDMRHLLRRMSSQIHYLPIQMWNLSAGISLGFEPLSTCKFTDCSYTFCLSRQGYVSFKTSTFTFQWRRRNRLSRLAEHFEYNYIPAHLSSIQSFHFKRVVCSSENVIILLLTSSVQAAFCVLDLQRNRFLGIFGKQLLQSQSPRNISASLSPDNRYCLIRLQPWYPGGRDDVNLPPFRLELYDIVVRQLLRSWEINSSGCLFSFDPRFGHSRLVITCFPGNDSRQRIVNNNNAVLMRWTSGTNNVEDTIIAENDAINDVDGTLEGLLSIQHVPDGRHVVALCYSGPANCICAMSKSRRLANYCLFILNADTLNPLSSISFSRDVCPLHTCLLNVVPQPSRCSSRLAFIVNDPVTPPLQFVEVVPLRSPVTSLQECCRISIRRAVRSNVGLDLLPIPPCLLDFLRYRPLFEVPVHTNV